MCPTGLVNSEADQFSGVFYSYFYNNVISWFHLFFLQDPPNIPLYVALKEVVMNGVKLTKFRCRRGSNALEGMHSHIFRAIPSHRCGIMPFQVNIQTFNSTINMILKNVL